MQMFGGQVNKNSNISRNNSYDSDGPAEKLARGTGKNNFTEEYRNPIAVPTQSEKMPLMIEETKGFSSHESPREIYINATISPSNRML